MIGGAMGKLNLETSKSPTPFFAGSIGDVFPLCTELPDAMQRLLRRLAENEVTQLPVGRSTPAEECHD